MWGLTIFTFLSFFLGGVLGKYVASKGVSLDFTIDNPKYQKWILIILAIVPLLIVALNLAKKYNISQKVILFIPDIVVLYLGEYLYDLGIIFCTIITGFILGLGLFNQLTFNGKIKLFSLVIIISFCLSLLVHKTLPIVGELKEPKIINNIVLQTTDVTCSPATIANLGRFTGKYPELTEKQVVLLTNTDRLGTSILAEIRALKKLGFKPEYHRGLMITDLYKINQPGILHVQEKIANQRIAHAIALFSSEPKTKTFELVNPLYGLENKPEQEMKDYWYGEAIFVQADNFNSLGSK